MRIRDNRFYMTPGSRWRITNSIYTDTLRYPRGSEFTLHAYDDNSRKLAIRCPEHTEYYECASDARRYGQHKFVTGTINYSRVNSFQIDLIEPARGKVYFIRVRDRFFCRITDPLITTRQANDAPVFMQELPAWKTLVMDAAKIMKYREHDTFNLDPFTLHAYDPMTETEYSQELPEWKHRMFRFMSNELQYTAWGSTVASEIEKQLPKARGGGRFIFFRNAEDAVLAKMMIEQQVDLFVP